MASSLFISMKKLRGQGIIRTAAKHNYRELLMEVGPDSDGRIDQSRTHLNYVVSGPATAEGVAKRRQDLLNSAKLKKMRKDAVQGIELIFSLPSDTTIDYRTYFEVATKWVESYFSVPLLSSVVHLDEAAPHCHVLLLPLVNGRMNGSALMGTRSNLHSIQSNFYVQVAQCHGLHRNAPTKRLSGAAKRDAAALVLNAISADMDLLNDRDVRQALSAAISLNPEPFIKALGLNLPKPKAKKETFVGIMTKPVKPENPIGFGPVQPIEFLDSGTSIELQTLSCVGFAQVAQSDPIESGPQAKAGDVTSSGEGAKAFSSDSCEGAVPLPRNPSGHPTDDGLLIVPRTTKESKFRRYMDRVSKTRRVQTAVDVVPTCDGVGAATWLFRTSPCGPSERGPPKNCQWPFDYCSTLAGQPVLAFSQ